MSESETPPRQMRARSGEHNLVDYRLDRIEESIRSMTKEVRSFMEHVREHESDSIRAIERCGRHDEQLKALHDTIIPAINGRVDDAVTAVAEVAAGGGGGRERLSFWTSVGALVAGVGSTLLHFFGGGKS